MDYIYIVSSIGFFLPEFKVHSAVVLLICNILILFYINRNLKIFFNDNNITLFGDIDRPNGKKYGMPSGHSQVATFTLLFLYFTYKKFNNYFLIYYFCILIQRIVSNKHTFSQVVVGAVFGILTYVFYNYVKDYL